MKPYLVSRYTTPYRRLTWIATGKSPVASAGKNTSTAFLVNTGFSGAWSISTMCSLAPVPVRTAKVNSL